MGSHVVTSVERRNGRNYWTKAAIRSKRFRLFSGSSEQVPEKKGQAKRIFSMKNAVKTGRNGRLAPSPVLGVRANAGGQRREQYSAMLDFCENLES
jgi:hypothetical protein